MKHQSIRLFLGAAAMLLLSACSGLQPEDVYKPSINTENGTLDQVGFSVHKVDDGFVGIFFNQGCKEKHWGRPEDYKPLISDELADDLLMLKAAELCQSEGKLYFARRGWTVKSTPTANNPFLRSLMVKFHNAQSETPFELHLASKVRSDLRAKLGINQ